MYRANSKVSASFALVGLIYQILFPQYAWNGDNLAEQQIELSQVDELVTIQGRALVQTANPDMPKVVSRQWVTVTAYSSTADQTDSTPFITASGTQVRDGVVACNFLRFGTRVRFPQLYGDKIFVVEDRMAWRNSYKIDIWFASRDQAKQFGIRQLQVEVLET